MNVRAKFRCTEATREGDSVQVRFQAVTNDNTDNAQWSKWTPAGELSMVITNERCFDAFKPGEEYFLDIAAVRVGA